MKKAEDSSSRREIMPPNLYNFYVQARINTYAGNAKPIDSLTVAGSKGFRYHQEGSPYYYQDEYFDDPQRPGNFAGFEFIREDSYEGRVFTLYTYGGGLSSKGLKLKEKPTYQRLQRFLKRYVTEVRFGRTVKYQFEDEAGEWTYEGQGNITEWGWYDRELIFLDGILVHEVSATGVSFILGF